MDEDRNNNNNNNNNKNEISPQSFQQCGQQIYDDDISHAYNMILKKVLKNKHDSLVNELHLITNEITDLNSNINELTSNYYLNTKKLSANTSNLMFLRNRYGVTIFQFNKFVNEMKENVKTYENERKIILSTIETTTAQLNEVNHKIEEYLYH
jgi:vacuolar-type H+-ATPase subunit D/Vma8